MICCAVSAGKDLDLSKISIKLFYTDDIAAVDFESPDEEYAVQRKTFKVNRVCSKSGEYKLTYFDAKKMCVMLEKEEILNLCPVSVVWMHSFEKFERLKSARTFEMFPMLAYTGRKFEDVYTNSHVIFGKHSNKILYSSFLCTVLCETLFNMGIHVSRPFLNCFGQVYVNEHIKVYIDAFFENEKHGIDILKYSKQNHDGINIDDRVDIDNVDESNFVKSNYTECRHRCAANIKRDCFYNVLEIVRKSCAKGFGTDYVKRRIGVMVKKAVDEIKELCSDFLNPSMIESVSDIDYLTYSEVLTLFVKAKARINVKSTIRKSKERCRYLNKLKIPDVVYPDGRFVYLQNM